MRRCAAGQSASTTACASSNAPTTGHTHRGVLIRSCVAVIRSPSGRTADDGSGRPVPDPQAGRRTIAGEDGDRESAGESTDSAARRLQSFPTFGSTKTSTARCDDCTDVALPSAKGQDDPVAGVSDIGRRRVDRCRAGRGDAQRDGRRRQRWPAHGAGSAGQNIHRTAGSSGTVAVRLTSADYGAGRTPAAWRVPAGTARSRSYSG